MSEPDHLEFAAHSAREPESELAGASATSSELNSPSQTTLADEILKVRSIASTRLARLANIGRDHCQENYLLCQNLFVGIRFLLGGFQAEWNVGADCVLIKRDQQLLATLPIHGDRPSQRAA